MKRISQAEREGEEQIRSVSSRLIKIAEEESQNYELIAETFGLNLNHCVEFGLRHASDFGDRARYYTERDIPNPGYCCHVFELNRPKIFVRFYGDKDGK